MDLSQYTANWNYPTQVRQGIGRRAEIGQICEELDITAPMFVTDPGLTEMPMLQAINAQCDEQGLQASVFSDIVANPTEQNVQDGVAAYHKGLHDGVIAFGGGSAIDAAKAIALMVGQTRPLWDFEDVGDNWRRVNVNGIAPIIALPTTSGTGSEVGRASVITDATMKVKKLIFHPNMMPDVVILDPELTVGLPANLTAATGMDAFSHALEAYCAPYFHPMAEGIALEAIRLVKQYLQRATDHGTDLEARIKMQVASTMGATAFQKGLGGMHALAHPLGAIYNAHHGLLNAILMPYVLKANEAEITERIERLARYIETPNTSFAGFLDWVVELRENLNIPHSLAEIGIDHTQAQLVGDMAVEDPSAGGNPISFNAEQYANIFIRAVKGEL